MKYFSIRRLSPQDIYFIQNTDRDEEWIKEAFNLHPMDIQEVKKRSTVLSDIREAGEFEGWLWTPESAHIIKMLVLQGATPSEAKRYFHGKTYTQVKNKMKAVKKQLLADDYAVPLTSKQEVRAVNRSLREDTVAVRRLLELKIADDAELEIQDLARRKSEARKSSAQARKDAYNRFFEKYSVQVQEEFKQWRKERRTAEYKAHRQELEAKRAKKAEEVKARKARRRERLKEEARVHKMNFKGNK